MRKTPYQDYEPEFRAQVLKELKETNDFTAVSKKHGIPRSTIQEWTKKIKEGEDPRLKELREKRKEVLDLKLENEILKDLLKKTNHLWLKDSKPVKVTSTKDIVPKE